jgi:hypothetical protein
MILPGSHARPRRHDSAPTQKLRRAVGLVVLATFSVLISGCGAAAVPPLITPNLPKTIVCAEMPFAKLGILSWHTPIAFTTDWYVNQGRQPVTLKSVSLIDPHGLVLHQALVYEMLHARHPLSLAIAWSQADRGALPSAWNRRQLIPGAVIPTGHAAGVLTRLSNKDNLYVVVEDITATTPGGGWALGEKLAYLAGGSTYTIEVHTGIGIGSERVPFQNSCNDAYNTMQSKFGDRGGVGF